MADRLTPEDLAKSHSGLCGVVIGDGPCSCLVQWVEGLQKDLDAANLRIRDYQRALRKVDECCGCLDYGDEFKVLDRGTPDPKCEDCNRERYRCDCVDKQKPSEKPKCELDIPCLTHDDDKTWDAKKPKCGLSKPMGVGETCILEVGHPGPCNHTKNRKCDCGTSDESFHSQTCLKWK